MMLKITSTVTRNKMNPSFVTNTSSTKHLQSPADKQVKSGVVRQGKTTGLSVDRRVENLSTRGELV
jgi:hypothetical protein